MSWFIVVLFLFYFHFTLLSCVLFSFLSTPYWRIAVYPYL